MTVDPYATAENSASWLAFRLPDKQVNRSNAIFLPPYIRVGVPAHADHLSVGTDTHRRRGPSRRCRNRHRDRKPTVPRADGSMPTSRPSCARPTPTLLLVATGDRIVYEHYANGMHLTHPHQMMSCTKSSPGCSR